MNLALHRAETIETIFFLAHPDDEFSIFERIRRIQLENSRCLLVFCTKTKDISERRKIESLRVLSFFGISDQECIFLSDFINIEDGKAFEFADKLYKIITKIFNQLPNLNSIYIPAYEGGHQDHDLLHGLVCLAAQNCQPRAEIWQSFLYNSWRSSFIFFKVCNIIYKESNQINLLRIPFLYRLTYLVLCLRYQSQWRTWVGLLPFLGIHYLFNGNEAHMKIKEGAPEHLWQRPHSGKLLYERRNLCSFNVVQLALRKVKHQFLDK